MSVVWETSIGKVIKNSKAEKKTSQTNTNSNNFKNESIIVSSFVSFAFYY